MLTQGEHANSNPELCCCEVTFFISCSCFSFQTAAKETTASWIGKKSIVTRIGNKQTKALDQEGRRYLKTHQPPISRDEGVHMLSHSWESLRRWPVRHIRSFRPATRAQNSCWHDSSCQAAPLRKTSDASRNCLKITPTSQLCRQKTATVYLPISFWRDVFCQREERLELCDFVVIQFSCHKPGWTNDVALWETLLVLQFLFFFLLLLFWMTHSFTNVSDFTL